jgi:uncharacterized protein (DUF58 family)
MPPEAGWTCGAAWSEVASMAQTLFDPPTLERLRRVRMATGRVLTGGTRGERLSRQFGGGQEFGGHRPYTHGDDLRRVDWNVYGRLGQFFLKLFEQPGQLRMVLLADDSPTMDFGTPDKWLAARRVLGAVGLIALGGAERVVLARLSGQEPETYDGTGEERMLDSLSRWPVDGGSGTRSTAALIGGHGRDTLVVLASDFQNRGPALRALADARRQGARAVAFSIASPDELNPSLEGLARVQPVGGQSLKLRLDDAVLAAYREELARYREGIARAVKGTGAAFGEVLSSDPIEPVVTELARAGILKRPR